MQLAISVARSLQEARRGELESVHRVQAEFYEAQHSTRPHYVRVGKANYRQFEAIRSSTRGAMQLRAHAHDLCHVLCILICMSDVLCDFLPGTLRRSGAQPQAD